MTSNQMTVDPSISKTFKLGYAGYDKTFHGKLELVDWHAPLKFALNPICIASCGIEIF